MSFTQKHALAELDMYRYCKCNLHPLVLSEEIADIMLDYKLKRHQSLGQAPGYATSFINDTEYHSFFQLGRDHEQ